MARARLDADLLAAAYERDARRMLVFFTRRLYDAQLAVDVVAETYARAFELRRRFRGDPSDADALGSAASASSRRCSTPRSSRGSRISPSCRSCAARSPPRWRSCRCSSARPCGYGVVDELDYPTVADRLGISEQAARGRVSRGLCVLASTVDGLGGTGALT